MLENFRRWLGFADSNSAAAPAEAKAPELLELGTTGTSVFGGYLTDVGEYNPNLQGLAAMSTYEKMRRSDAQVAATLMSMKLPIRSAEWTVVAPDDATPVEKEAADLVRECLLEEIKFDAVIRNALLMLDFGVAAHEDVWKIDGNRVRIAKLAARLPITFQRWIVDDSENLTAIEQFGAKGNTYITVQVPAEKLAIFTNEQEGANFAGRSMLRPVYQHWYLKNNLYKVDAISIERNGMGVPYAIMGADSKKEDREAALRYLSQLAAHEKTSVLFPNGWDFGIKGVDGTLRDPKDSIAHHNMMIAMAALAQFMMLGQTQGGNRALGESLGDFFYLGLQATAKSIEEELNRSTVKRLVDYNFAGVKRYPRVIAQKIQAIQFETLYAALKELAGAGLVQGDDELESYLRKQMGLPEAGKNPRQVPQQQVPGQAKPPAPSNEIPPAQKPDGDSTGAPVVGGTAADLAQTRGARQVGRASLSDGVKTRREPRGAERFLALAEIVNELDRGRDEIAAALRKARSRVQAEVVNKLVNRPVRELHRVSIPLDEKLLGEVEAILRGVFEFGRDQVGEERGRQKSATDVRLAVKKRREPLGVYADATVSEFLNNITARAANVAADWMRRPADKTMGELIRTIELELDDQSDKWIDSTAAKGTNEAFADGRQAGYEEHADEIKSVMYSALLDMATCDVCSAADGEEGATPDDITAVPNPDCEGGDRCRCVHVYAFADEVPSEK